MYASPQSRVSPTVLSSALIAFSILCFASGMKKTLFTLALVLSIATSRADVFEINLNAANDPIGILSGAVEVGPNASTATGGEVGAGITYDDATSLLTIYVAYGLFGFQPLTGTFTATHLHRAGAGTNGPVFINLDVGATDIHTAVGPNAGFFNGSVPLTPAQETDLFANLIYINVHSSPAFAGGEIRAQLIPSVPPTTLAIQGPSQGEFDVILKGRRRQRYRLEASTNLTNWSPVASLTITNVDRTVSFKYTPALNEPQRFFRAVAE
jgi:hypothetical protein